MTELKGIAWDHPRGFDPMVETANLFQKTNPDIQIKWDKRPLQAFADRPIEEMAFDYDFMVIDHPHVGEASRKNLIYELNHNKKYENELLLLEKNSVGLSHQSYNFNGIKPSVIFDNITEFQPFKSIARNNKLNVDYPIEEHFKNLRKSKHTLLRIHRTWHPYRDNMLYYKTDYEVLDKIKNDIPIKSSQYERNLIVDSNDHITYSKGKHHISNEPIDNSVYEDSVFSWVNPSLPDKKNYVFINQSTFSPVLHYHPILWFGHTHLIKCFKSYGYKSFDWLFDESYDELTSDLDKFKANVKQVDKVMNMDKDYLIDLMWDNKDTLQHNRDLFIECKSIERIIRKLYGIINETEI